MNKTWHAVIDIILIAVMIAYILRFFGIITVSPEDIISFGLSSFGIVTVYFTLGTHRKGFLFTGTLVFLLGVIIYTTNHYTFMDSRVILIPSVLFLAGAGFLMLFIDDTSNRAFLISSAVLFVSFIGYILAGKNIRVLSLSNSLTNFFLDYYPVFIILIGVSLLVNRKNKQ
jgi:hypothetical protein